MLPDSDHQHSTVASFDRLAGVRERDERRHRTYYDDQVALIRSLIRPDATVAEIGCGIGAVISRLPNVRKTGIDLSPAMIALARKRDAVTRYVVGDAQRLTAEEQFDYVLLLDAINYFENVPKALAEIRMKLCHPSTRIVISYFSFLWLPAFRIGQALGLKTRFPEQNWLGRDQLKNLLSIAGFEVVEETQRLLCPVAIPFIASLCNNILVRLPFIRSLAVTKVMIARPIGFDRQTPSVSIISAVRNERGNIRSIAEQMPYMGTGTELIFVEGHSTDSTWEEIEKYEGVSANGVSIRGLKQTGKGKANALHEGIAACTGDIIVIYDGDYTVHPSELPPFIEILAKGQAEFLNGSRLVYPMEEGSMKLLNLIGNKIFSMLFSYIFAQKMVDVLSPLKALWRSDYHAVQTRMDPFGDFDFFLGAARKQRKMAEVPVHYLKRTYGTTKLSPFGHGWLLLKFCWKGARILMSPQ